MVAIVSLTPAAPVVAWSQWLSDILPHVPGCPGVLAERELLRAAQAFFARSRVWSVLTEAQAVSAGNAEIPLEFVGDALPEVVRVEAVWLDGKLLETVAAENAESVLDGDDWAAEEGEPQYALMLTPNVIRLYPIPVEPATIGLVVRATVRPSDTSPGLPSDLTARWREAILAGAKGRLMVYPKKPWTDVQLGAGLLAEASNQADAAQTAGLLRGHMRARRTLQPRWC